MQPQHNVTHSYHLNIPIIDMEFDRFEANDDLEPNLREAEFATFYHDACNQEE